MERIDKYFSGVAWKRLSSVDAEPTRSNQHEIGGLVKAGFKDHLGDPGTDTLQWKSRFIFLAEAQDESVSVSGSTSWYDSRRDQPDRSPELRLYYETNPVTERIRAGMFMLIAKTSDGQLLLVFAEPEGSAERQLRWLFGLDGDLSRFNAKTFDKALERASWASLWILDELGIETETADERWLGKILDRFGPTFPPTRKFSHFARGTIEDLDVCGSPDDAILALMETEERLFRLLERHIVEQRLEEGFDGVDDFISYSLSVQNRRKCRAGFAFENHLEYIFAENQLNFERGVYTENRSKPDFLFPGSSEYSDHTFATARLSMLGVKSSCKERWRQVLAEAERIREKHLATLEPGISTYQLAEMRDNTLQLVVPGPLHETYAAEHRGWLFAVSDFIRHIRDQQTRM